jgi:hypothetical protein
MIETCLYGEGYNLAITRPHGFRTLEGSFFTLNCPVLRPFCFREPQTRGGHCKKKAKFNHLLGNFVSPNRLETLPKTEQYREIVFLSLNYPEG